MKAHLLTTLFALVMLAPSSGQLPGPPFPTDSRREGIPVPMQVPMLDKPLKAIEPAPSPRLNEKNKAFDIIEVAPAEGSIRAAGNVAVSFYNHSDRELILEIDSRTITLGSRYYVQLKLPREFTWREKDGPERKTKVPETADGLEIVFRK